jgi:hypothetical protein
MYDLAVGEDEKFGRECAQVCGIIVCLLINVLLSASPSCQRRRGVYVVVVPPLLLVAVAVST